MTDPVLPTLGATSWYSYMQDLLTFAIGKASASAAPVSVKDHGATGNGSTDDSTAIQAAVTAAAGGSVRFPEGTYKIGTRIDLPSNTRIVAESGAVIDFSTVALTGSARVGFRAQGTVGTATNLTSDATKGTFTAAVTSAAGLAVGDWVRVSSTAEYAYSTGFKRGELKQIRSIATNTLTFEQPLYDTYTTATTGTVAKVSMVSNVDISGLAFRGANTPDHADRAVCLEFVAGFSVRDCVFTDIDQYCVYVRSSVSGEVSNNRFRGVFYDGVTGSIHYAILLSSATQWVRCHSNHGERVRHLITVSAATNDPGAPRHITCTGNVAQNMMAGAAGRSWAFECHGIGENIIFQGNVADGCYGGFVTRGPGVSIIGNTIRNWYGYAIHIHPDIRDARDILVQGNTVQDRTVEGGGFATPAAIRAELSGATTVANLVISDNVLAFDVTGRAAVDVDGATVTASSLLIRDNTIVHPSASVDSISCTVKGSHRRGNSINGLVEGDGSLEQFRSALVSTMPRQFLVSSIGTVGSGVLYSGRAKVMRGGTYSKIRFCTGTSAPVVTDFRGGVWTSDGSVLAETGNESATVNAASTVYELSLTVPVTLNAGQEVFLGFGAIGGTPGTYRGAASFSGVTNIDPPIARQRSGWTTGAVLTVTTASSLIPWVELIT